jgi:pimeloyl-ACP methyl ester carboxylesterase
MAISTFIRARRLVLSALLALAPLAALGSDFSSERISVTVQGEGRDVILVPGLGSSPRVWAELVKAVPGYRYHLVQLAGFAGAPKGGNTEGAVAAPVATELARYIQANGLKQPAVVGHSMGGAIGMMLAARHSQSVGRLMVVDMVPFMGVMFGPPGTTSHSVRPTADMILARMTAAEPAERKKNIETVMVGMVDTAAMRPFAIADSIGSDPGVGARSYHELIVTDLGPELARITAPTTVLYVTPRGVPLSDAQMDGVYQAAYGPLKGAVLKRIPNSAHFIMWDQPARFQAEVKAFLQ